MGLLSSDSHYRRLPRSARHLARAMLRRGTGYQRASVVRAAGNALAYAAEVEHNPGARTPDQGGDAAGQRVRIGAETRDLLKRLLASRNRLHQMALVKEIRQQIAKRIAIHQKRSRQLRSARARTRAVGRTAVAWGSAARTRALQPPRARASQPVRGRAAAGAAPPKRATAARLNRSRATRT